MNTNLTAMTPAQLGEAILGENPEIWGNRTDEELDALMLRLRGHWSQNNVFICSPLLHWVLAAIVAAGVMVALNPAEQMLWLEWVFVYGMVTFMVGGVIAGCVGACAAAGGSFDIQRVLKQLEPLGASQYYCAKALQLVRKSPGARYYRDQVTATGRQLRVVDCTVLSNLAAVEDFAAAQEAQKAACLELHGLTA